MAFDPARVQALVNDYRQRLAAGERISALEFCQGDAEAAELLQRQLAHATVRSDNEASPPASPDCPSPDPLDSRDHHASNLPPALTGRYRPLSLLAQGGLGQIFVARDEEIDRVVALKRMDPERIRRGYDPAKFEFEARVTGRLEHPSIVPIYGLGRDATGSPVYAMRLIRGGTLGDALETYHRGIADRRPGESRMQLQQLLRHFLAVCQAVAYAHGQGVVHRDIKPANVMLGDYGETLLVDWGLAKEFNRAGLSPENPCPELDSTTGIGSFPEPNATVVGDSSGADETALGVIKGSPGYMSPEQADGRTNDIGPSSDIYSLGATLYAILAGRPPFEGREPLKVIQDVRRGEFPRPRALQPRTPRPLEAICLKAMHRDSLQRYASPLDLASDIEHWLADEPISAWREPWQLRIARWVRRNRKLAAAILGSCVLLASVLVGSAWLLQTERENRQDAARQEDAADFAMLKEQIRAERFWESQQTLRTARERMAREPDLHHRQQAWDRMTAIVDFYRRNDEMWNAWGEENYPAVIATAQQATEELLTNRSGRWWESLPSDDLSPEERDRLEQEVYRMLMISSAVRSIIGSVRAELPDADTREAIPLFQSAMQLMEQAQRWERSRTGADSISSNIMQRLNHGLLSRLGQPLSADDGRARGPQKSAADDYFLGLMFFFIERSANRSQVICSPQEESAGTEERAAEGRGQPSPEPEPANMAKRESPTPPSGETTGTAGLLRSFLSRELQKHDLPVGTSYLETSERYLRLAAGRERRYWPNFALGRTLYYQREYEAAELAFGTCAVLRPDYARSYEQRALMRALQSLSPNSSLDQDALQNLAREDSERALALALPIGDSSTWWPRGDLLGLLQDKLGALQAYRLALEWEDDIRQKVNRRNNVASAQLVAESVLGAEETTKELKADAHAVLALGFWALGELACADQHTGSALALVGDHPHALTVRAILVLQAEPSDADVEQAITDLETALRQSNDNYLAAVSRAQALERLERFASAATAWEYVVNELGTETTGPHQPRLSDPQRRAAQQALRNAQSNRDALPGSSRKYPDKTHARRNGTRDLLSVGGGRKTSSRRPPANGK